MKIMQTVFYRLSIFILFSLSVSSCDDQPKPDAKDIAKDHNNAKFNDENKVKDAQFLVDAAEICLQEIQLAQLAQQNSIKKSVQKMGKTMQDEYTEYYSKLKDLSAKKAITIPSELSNKNKSLYKDLSFQIADDFDKKYFDLIVKDHKEAIEKFEKEASETNDLDIKAWTLGMLSDLRKNLAVIIDKKKIIMTTIHHIKLKV